MNNNNKKKYRKIALLATAAVGMFAGSMSAMGGGAEYTTNGGNAVTNAQLNWNPAILAGPASGSWFTYGAGGHVITQNVLNYEILSIDMTANAPGANGLVLNNNTTTLLGSVSGGNALAIQAQGGAPVILTLTGKHGTTGNHNGFANNTYDKLASIDANGNALTVNITAQNGAVINWAGKFANGAANTTLNVNTDFAQTNTAANGADLKAVNIAAAHKYALTNNGANDTTIGAANALGQQLVLAGAGATFEFENTDNTAVRTLSIKGFDNTGGNLVFKSTAANGLIIDTGAVGGFGLGTAGNLAKKLETITLNANAGAITINEFTGVYASKANLDLTAAITADANAGFHFDNTTVTNGANTLTLNKVSELGNFDFANKNATVVANTAGQGLTIAPKSTGSGPADIATAGTVRIPNASDLTLTDTAGIVTFDAADTADTPFKRVTSIQNLASNLTLGNAGNVNVSGVAGFGTIAANAGSVFKLADKALLVARSADGNAGGFALNAVGVADTIQFAGDGRIITREMGVNGGFGLGNIQLSALPSKKNVIEATKIALGTGGNNRNIIFREATTTLEFNGVNEIVAQAGNGINVANKAAATIRFKGNMALANQDTLKWTTANSGIANVANDTIIASAVKDNTGNSAGYLSLGNIDIGTAALPVGKLVSEGGGFSLDAANSYLVSVDLGTYDVPVALNKANGNYKLVMTNAKDKGSVEVYESGTIVEGSTLGKTATPLKNALSFQRDNKDITLETGVNAYGGINYAAGVNTGGVVYLKGDTHTISGEIKDISAIYAIGTKNANTTHTISFTNATAPKNMKFGFVAEQGSTVVFNTGDTTKLTGISFVSGSVVAKAGGGLATIGSLNDPIPLVTAIAPFAPNNANPVVFTFNNDSALAIENAWIIADTINLTGKGDLDLSEANNTVYVNNIALGDKTLTINSVPTAGVNNGTLINTITTTTNGKGAITIKPTAPANVIDLTVATIHWGTTDKHIGAINLADEMTLQTNEKGFFDSLTVGKDNVGIVEFTNTDTAKAATIYKTPVSNNSRIKELKILEGGAVTISDDASAYKFTIINTKGVTFTTALTGKAREFALGANTPLTLDADASVITGSRVTAVPNSTGHTFNFNGGGLIPTVGASAATPAVITPITNVNFTNTFPNTPTADTNKAAQLDGSVYATTLKVKGAFGLTDKTNNTTISATTGTFTDVDMDLGVWAKSNKDLVFAGTDKVEGAFTLWANATIASTNGATTITNNKVKVSGTTDFANATAFNVHLAPAVLSLDQQKVELKLIETATGGTITGLDTLYGKLNGDAGIFAKITAEGAANNKKLYVTTDLKGGADKLAVIAPNAGDVAAWIRKGGVTAGSAAAEWLKKIGGATTADQKVMMEEIEGGAKATTAGVSSGVVSALSNNIVNTQLSSAQLVKASEELGTSAGDDVGNLGINVYVQGFGSHSERDKHYKSNLGGGGVGVEFYPDEAKKLLVGVFGWGAKTKTKTTIGGIKTDTDLGGATVYGMYDATESFYAQGSFTYGAGKSKFKGTDGKSNETLYDINALVGYKYKVGDKFDVTPLIGVDFFNSTRGSTTLSTGRTKPKATDSRVSLVLGGKLSSVINANDMVFIPSAYVLFNIGNGKTPKSELAIQGASNNITVGSKKQPVVTTLGFNLAGKKDQFEGSIGVSGDLAPKQHSVSGVIKLKVGF